MVTLLVVIEDVDDVVVVVVVAAVVVFVAVVVVKLHDNIQLFLCCETCTYYNCNICTLNVVVALSIQCLFGSKNGKQVH